MKSCEEDKLEEAAGKALMQIEEKHYADKLHKGKFNRIRKYGIACYQKECKVVAE